MPNGKCTIGADVQARTKVLEERFKKTDGTFDRIFTELKEIRGLLTGRPTWMTLGIISFLSSTTVGLLVVLFRVIK